MTFWLHTAPEVETGNIKANHNSVRGHAGLGQAANEAKVRNDGGALAAKAARNPAETRSEM